MKPHTISFALAVTIAITSCNKNETQQETSTDKVEQAQPATPKHDELANKTMDLMGEFANTFTTITDLDTANAAAKKIDEIGDQFTAIAEELNKIDPPTLELRKEIKKKIEAKEAEMQNIMSDDLSKAMQALSEESQMVVQKASVDFFGKMNTVGPVFEKHFDVAEDGDADSE